MRSGRTWGQFARSGLAGPITLGADEERALELKREMAAGQERVVWNADLSLPAKEFEFSDPEVGKTRSALQTRESYAAG